MYEERNENEGARHTCIICGGAVIEGVLTPEGEAICRKCLNSMNIEELLVLCDLSDTAELLTCLGYYAL